MIEVDWLQFAVAATIGMAALVGGAWAGYLGGKNGHGRFRTFGRAVGRSALLILVSTAVIAAVLAHRELRVEAGEPGNFVELKAPAGAAGLKLNHEEWWEGEVAKHNITHWCNCPRCWPEYPSNPTNVVNRAMGRATIWAFLAPVFCIAGAVPAIVAAAFAFNFGAKVRIEQRWQREQMARSA